MEGNQVSKKTHDVVAVTGKYTDREGNEKNRYLNIGAVIHGKHGPMLKLEAVPVGWDGWAYLNEPKPRDEAKPAKQASDDFDDRVPF